MIPNPLRPPSLRNRKAQQGRACIVFLAHSRVAHATKAIDALSKARGFSEHSLVVIVDGDWPETESAILSLVEPNVLLQPKQECSLPARARILRNLEEALEYGFKELRAPYCVVVEDDIIVSADFLRFIEACMVKFGGNRRFRAVNGFSRTYVTESESAEGFVLGNYGVGWGWALPSSTWWRVRAMFRWPGDYHWDALIEPYIRTGFVVNPIRSRVVNIGFDDSGSHTSNNTHAELGEEMERSFLGDSSWRSDDSSLRQYNGRFLWRNDYIELGSRGYGFRNLVFLVGSLHLFLHRLRNVALRLNLKRVQATLSSEIRFLRLSSYTALGGMRFGRGRKRSAD